MTPPKPRHGKVCVRIAMLLQLHADAQRCGHVFGNDSGVVTERDPDTLRGADVAYYSYGRLPEDANLDEFPTVTPELVVEVKSPSDRWSAIATKVSEYLTAGVTVVCVVDPQQRVVFLHYPDATPEKLLVDDILEFPAVLPGFRVPVTDVFK